MKIPDTVKNKLLKLLDELYIHDGHGVLTVEMRILKRRQKEVLLKCGKEYRFVVDYMNQMKTDMGGDQ